MSEITKVLETSEWWANKHLAMEQEREKESQTARMSKFEKKYNLDSKLLINNGRYTDDNCTTYKYADSHIHKFRYNAKTMEWTILES